MKMDFDIFIGHIFQKDVNNYFLIDRETGAVKAKGAYGKKLSDLDYDLPIVNRAIVEYFTTGAPPEKTIGAMNGFRAAVKAAMGAGGTHPKPRQSPPWPRKRAN